MDALGQQRALDKQLSLGDITAEDYEREMNVIGAEADKLGRPAKAERVDVDPDERASILVKSIIRRQAKKNGKNKSVTFGGVQQRKIPKGRVFR